MEITAPASNELVLEIGKASLQTSDLCAVEKPVKCESSKNNINDVIQDLKEIKHENKTCNEIGDHKVIKTESKTCIEIDDHKVIKTESKTCSEICDHEGNETESTTHAAEMHHHKGIITDMKCSEEKSLNEITDAFLAEFLSNSNHASDSSDEAKEESETSNTFELQSESKELTSRSEVLHHNDSVAGNMQSAEFKEYSHSGNFDEASNNRIKERERDPENSSLIDRQAISDSGNKETAVIKVSKEGCDTGKKSEYRCDSDTWSEDEDSSSTSSDSSTDSASSFLNVMREGLGPKKFPDVKTKGELDLNDLPPIEDLVISVSENEMEKIGKVHAIVGTLVVVHAFKESKPLDLDSVLFLAHGQPLGRVFDVFGPVIEPFYSVRFNSVDHINEKGVNIQDDVFFVPDKKDFTTYVFLEELKNEKGSDASWKHNNEPPEECLDYSDDEKERAARRKRTAKHRNRNNIDNADIAAKRHSALGTDDDPIFIPPPRPPNRNFRGSSLQYSRRNPFSNPRSPSLYSFPRVHVQNSFSNRARLPYAFQSPPPSMAFQQSPRSPFLLPSYQQPVFGQVPLYNPLSPAVQSPLPSPSPFQSPSPFISAFQSPVMSNIPALVSTNPVTAQNYINQRLSRTPSPSLRNGPLTPDPWLPNRAPVSLSNIPPNAPLTVQIPSTFSTPSLSAQPFETTNQQNVSFLQPFANQQNLNLRQPFVNQQGINFQQPFLNQSNVHFSGASSHPRM